MGPISRTDCRCTHQGDGQYHIENVLETGILQSTWWSRNFESSIRCPFTLEVDASTKPRRLLKWLNLRTRKSQVVLEVPKFWSCVYSSISFAKKNLCTEFRIFWWESLAGLTRYNSWNEGFWDNTMTMPISGLPCSHAHGERILRILTNVNSAARSHVHVQFNHVCLLQP